MSDGSLSFEHGEVWLGGERVPGVLRGQSIRGCVRFDEAETDGLSGKVKTPLGWEDADIQLRLDLISDQQMKPYVDGEDCYEKLAELNRIFKGYDNGGNPQVYDIVNAHVTARGIDQVVFAGLDSRETDRDDIIRATLSFTEHKPPVQRVEAQAVAADQALGSSTPGVNTADPEPDTAIMVDVN